MRREERFASRPVAAEGEPISGEWRISTANANYRRMDVGKAGATQGAKGVLRAVLAKRTMKSAFLCRNRTLTRVKSPNR